MHSGEPGLRDVAARIRRARPAPGDEPVAGDPDAREPEPAGCRAAHAERIEAGQPFHAGRAEVDQKVDDGCVGGSVEPSSATAAR